MSILTFGLGALTLLSGLISLHIEDERERARPRNVGIGLSLLAAGVVLILGARLW